jgi:ubiquinone biosynthesis protein
MATRGNGISSLARLRFILTTVFLFGGRYLLRRLRLLYLVPWRLRLRSLFKGQEDGRGLLAEGDELTAFSPPVLRELLETLGPTFVKLGQILSLRPDFVGEEISRELAKLQSGVPQFPFEQVERTIREDLGKDPTELFSGLQPVPVAAASLAQVHRAFLRDGTEVAIKVRRPGIRKTIEQDIRLLAYLARLAERFVPEVRFYNPVKVVDEFADWTRRELDFSVEGHNAERFRYAFRDNPYIKVPRIYWEFTSPRVLTMEYVEGVRADDLGGISQAGLDPKDLALHGVNAQLKQILIDGFFHADPHPGNSFALPGNVLCFYDFGMVGYLDERQRRELTGCFVAFANKDMEHFLEHFLHMATTTEASDIAGFRKDASEVLNEMFFSPTNPSMAWIFFRLIHSGARRRIGFPADLALFSKALITTEAMGIGLYPEFDFNEHLAPFVTRTFKACFDPEQLRRSFANDFIDYVDLFRDVPRRIQDLVRRFEKKEAVDLRLDSRDMEILERELARQADRRMAEVSLLGAVFLVSTIAVTRFFGGPWGVTLLEAAVAFFFLLSCVFLFRARKRE